MANTIKIKRGLSSNIDNTTLAQGELAITTDTNELYVGTESGNTKLNEPSLKNIVDGKAKGSIRSIDAHDITGYLLGKYAQAFGQNTTASGEISHAEGNHTTASGTISHAEGWGTVASGDYSHAEGSNTQASNSGSHAEGYGAKASGAASHAEGDYTIASGNSSHAEGYSTEALGAYSHAEGYSTIAQRNNQHVQGVFNIEDETSAHIIGNGVYNKKSNAHTIDWSGNAWFAGDVYTGSTSGTNKDAGSKKLATEEFVHNGIPTKVSQLDNDSGYITDYSLKNIHDDGTNLFGWGATATDGTDMTAEYGMQADEVAGVYIGATYEWQSRLSFSAMNYGMVTYCIMDTGTADDGTKYNIVHIVMDGSEYDYVYSSSQNKVYKGIAWGGESGGQACFTGDTLVLTADGPKPIKEIKVGDKVLTVNTMKTAVVKRPITKLVSHEETEIYKLYVNGEIIETTASHPFVTKEKGRCNARILEKGMTLIDMNGNGHTIDNIETASTNIIVYEIVVDETRNYFVGNSNIQVYNEPSSYLEKKEA